MFECENKDTSTARRTSRRKSHEKILKHIKKPLWGLLLVAKVDKNPPANAENMGLIPSPGGFHKPRGN